MNERTYDWKQGGTQYRLSVNETPSNYKCYITIGDDVSILTNNPITIYIRFESLSIHNCRSYKMAVDGITVKEIAYVDAVMIAKALNCELTEQCDMCQEVSPLMHSLDLDHTHICMNCLKTIS